MDKKKLVLPAAIGAAAGVTVYQIRKYIRKSKSRKKLETTVPHKQGFYEKYVKRPLDVCCASAALVVLSPVLAVTAVLVRIKLGSPVIFTQERPGLNGEIFKLYKFRTMTDERNENGELLPDEDRLTKFGTWLRSMSIDELPELWNILRGDAALCGPRPLLPAYLSAYNEHQARRHEVRPGLTGYAQVHGRNSISWEEKFDMDVWYEAFANAIKRMKNDVSNRKMFGQANIEIADRYDVKEVNRCMRKIYEVF